MRLRLTARRSARRSWPPVGGGARLAQGGDGRRRPARPERGRRDDRRPDAGLAGADAVRSTPSSPPSGATFANSFTNWPLCCPSRATFYTGQYAHNHRVLGNSPPDGGFVSFNDSSALPVWLQGAGYRTIHVGKYLNGYGDGANDPAYVPPGWDEWYAGTAGSTQTVYGYTLNQNGTLVDYGTAVEDFKQDVFTDIAVDAINRNAPGGPFFMGVMYTAPHSGGPNPNPHPPTNCNALRQARAAPRDRLRLRAAARRRRTSTRPTSPTSRRRSRACRSIDDRRLQQHPAPLPLPDRVAALGRRRRRADRRRARGGRRARRTR